ncbi:MAG TPA: hypothetical protein VI522_07050 [Gammaproteobacteria bacterium]|nr:hypothetical protein [Gammaproteobacteria bacterium]
MTPEQFTQIAGEFPLQLNMIENNHQAASDDTTQKIIQMAFFAQIYAAILNYFNQIREDHKNDNAYAFAGKIFILLLTVMFMVICGMTTGGFILEQVAGNNTQDWHKAVAILGTIFNANAQKTIFFDPMKKLVDLLTVWILTAHASDHYALIVVTFLSGVCSFLINYGLSSFGAELFMIAILGASGPPGWVALAFALFFGLMNALLVLSGTLSTISEMPKGGNAINIMMHQFFKHVVLSLIVGAVVIWGLLMNFYPGADEVAKKFGGLIVAGLLLLGALWTEAYFAYKKLMHTWQAGYKNLPKYTLWDVWDKFCAIANAVTQAFYGVEGGERAAGAMNASDGSAQAIQTFAGMGAGLISYAYTVEDPNNNTSQEEMNKAPEKDKKIEQKSAPASSHGKCNSLIADQFKLFIAKPASSITHSNTTDSDFSLKA